MGNASASFTLPNPKPACYRALFWTSRKLGLRDFEISDHNRQVIQTTITLDRAMTPAATLRRRLRDRLDTNTMAILWTSPDDITTALAVSIEHIWTLTTQRGTNISQLYSSPNTIAHTGGAHLFLGKVFSLNHPSLPWKNPNWKTQA